MRMGHKHGGLGPVASAEGSRHDGRSARAKTASEGVERVGDGQGVAERGEGFRSQAPDEDGLGHLGHVHGNRTHRHEAAKAQQMAAHGAGCEGAADGYGLATLPIAVRAGAGGAAGRLGAALQAAYSK